MQVSSLFVVLMGMGVTFFGLICLIFLTLLLGKLAGFSPSFFLAVARPLSLSLLPSLFLPAIL